MDCSPPGSSYILPNQETRRNSFTQVFPVTWQRICISLVFPTSKTTTLDVTTTAAINAATTTAKLWVPEEVRGSGAWLLSDEAVSKATLASAVLKISIVALIAYLLWKRIKG